jgi:uncharacterized membrane protein
MQEGSQRTMTLGARNARDILPRGEMRRLAVFSVVLLIVVPTIALLAGGGDVFEASWRPRLDLAAFNAAPLATRVHAAAILALVVASWVMVLLPKGDRRHRILGWTWVIAMSVMGAASLSVPHSDSWVAGYIGGGSALGLMAYAVYAVKQRNLATHGRMMSILIIALVLMTFLALFPGRLLHSVVFGG